MRYFVDMRLRLQCCWVIGHIMASIVVVALLTVGMRSSARGAGLWPFQPIPRLGIDGSVIIRRYLLFMHTRNRLDAY